MYVVLWSEEQGPGFNIENIQLLLYVSNLLLFH